MKIYPRFFGIAMIYVLATACTTAMEESIRAQDELPVLGSPITLQPDTTLIHLTDYLPQPEKVTEIVLPEGLDFFRHPENHTLQLWGQVSDLPLLSVMQVHLGTGEQYHIPLRKSEKAELVFRLADQGYSEVAVKGEMNAWNAGAGPMQKLEGGEWFLSLRTDPGIYQYKFVVDGKEILDPLNPDSVDNNIGGFNSIIKAGDPDAPRPSLLTHHYDDTGIYLESDSDNLQMLVFWQNQQIRAEIKDGQLFIPLQESMKNRQRSYIRVFAADRSKEALALRIPLEYGRVVSSAEQLTRRDKERTIMYFLMVDRFRNGRKDNDFPENHPEIHPKANHFGGDLAGVIEKLKSGYFDSLGMNTIWLSPIVQNAEGAYGAYPEPFTRFSSYHGYWPVSFNRVDYRYGTTEELKELVDEAHRRDMNVLLDFVANHVHENHPFYQANPDVATNLYLPDGSLNTERWDDHRLTTWFDVFMPTLDLERPEVAEMLSDSAIFWLKNYGIDGFRHDATKHIPHSFWRTLTQKVNKEVMLAENRPVLQIGETYGSPELISSYINSGELDAQFDFNLYDDLVATFARPETPMTRLAGSLNKSLSYYGQHHLMGNMTGNQDRARFMAYADGSLRFDEDPKYVGWTRDIQIKDQAAYAKIHALQAFLMTAPGIPVLYYGDEIGMTGAGDPDNRRMMRFDELGEKEYTTRQITSQLATWRGASLPLMLGQSLVLHADEHTLAMGRVYFDEVVFTVFNKSDSPKTIQLPSLGRDFSTPRLFAGHQVESSREELSIVLPPHSFEIISNR